MQDPAHETAPPKIEGEQTQKAAAVRPGYYGLRILPPLSAVVELAALALMIHAADVAWPALDVYNLQPSPYWLPVLLLTLHYGTASGTLAVIVAILAYFTFGTLPEQGVGENEFAYRLRILAQPILWIGAAVILGQFRMRQISVKQELTRRVEELLTQRDTLAAYAQGLRSRCDALERDIVARPSSEQASLLDALSKLETAAPQPAGATRTSPAVLAPVLASAFPGTVLSLFAYDGHDFRKVAAEGWQDKDNWLAALPGSHSLAKEILAKSRPNALNAADDAVLDGQGLAAVPVLDPATGDVSGMIKIERCQASVLQPGLIQQLDALAVLLAPALSASQRSATLARDTFGERERLKASG